MAGQVERLVTQAVASSSQAATPCYTAEQSPLSALNEDAEETEALDYAETHCASHVPAVVTNSDTGIGCAEREGASERSGPAAATSPQLTVKVQAGRREPVYVDASWLEFSVSLSVFCLRMREVDVRQTTTISVEV